MSLVGHVSCIVKYMYSIYKESKFNKFLLSKERSHSSVQAVIVCVKQACTVLLKGYVGTICVVRILMRLKLVSASQMWNSFFFNTEASTYEQLVADVKKCCAEKKEKKELPDNFYLCLAPKGHIENNSEHESQRFVPVGELSFLPVGPEPHLRRSLSKTLPAHPPGFWTAICISVVAPLAIIPFY